ncbi:MAG: response regulator transcription factor [Flavobacteriales bacterium]|nr:response regulator transcription factor [Flavobacteriales bacterium]
MEEIDFGSKKQKTTVALVDDHALFRQGLRLVLNTYEDLEVIYEASNGKELIEQLVNGEPDVIFMDINMPEMDGLKTTKKLRQHFPQIKIIVLSMYNEKRFIIEMIKHGANGYLFKNSVPEELYAAIQHSIQDGFYFNDYMTKELFRGWANKNSSAKLLASSKMLSSRDLEVLRLICKQFKSHEIAERLVLHPRAVDHYRHRLLSKLDVRNTAGLVIYAIEHGLVDLNISKRRRNPPKEA